MIRELAVRRPYFDNRELSVIAMLASLHFAAAFASRMFDAVLMAFTGPFFIYVSGLGDEGVPSLLLATTVALVPRVGTASLSLATVWLLNGLVTGTFTLVNLQTITASIVLHELLLGVSGVTLESAWRSTGARPPVSAIVRTALAIGVANGAAMFVNYLIFMNQLGQDFATWYISSVAIIVAGGYGAAGAAIGAAWGAMLRRTSPGETLSTKSRRSMSWASATRFPVAIGRRSPMFHSRCHLDRGPSSRARPVRENRLYCARSSA